MMLNQYLSIMGVSSWYLRQPSTVFVAFPFYQGSHQVGVLLANPLQVLDGDTNQATPFIQAMLKAVGCCISLNVADSLELTDLDLTKKVVIAIGDSAVQQSAQYRGVAGIIALPDLGFLLKNPLEKRAIWKLLKMNSKLFEFT
jgi:hypothetical protein